MTPCRNGAPTLERALRSVREQGYPDLEHIVVDGASTDGTLEILARTPGIRYVSEPDRGLSDALNKGIEMATGDVIGWLNADDFYVPGALATVGAAFEANPDLEWCTGVSIIVDGLDQEIRRGVTAYKSRLLRHYSLPLLLTQNFVAAPSTFIRRDALQTVGPFAERLKYSMDYDVWLRLARRGPAIVINQPLAAFRMAEGSLSMTGFVAQFEEHLEVARAHGTGHRAAVLVNAVMSRLIVLVYKLLAWRRRRRRGPHGAAL